MNLNENDKIRLDKAYNLFMKKYGNNYTKQQLEYINSKYLKDLNEQYIDIKNTMLQIYTEIGLFSDDKNIYKAILEKLKKKHNIYSDILEVAGGSFPIMSKYIDEEQQKIGKGTITVYDPQLITDKLGNIILIKEEFNEKINVKNYDLIIGISPCKTEELIIKKANEEKKEFFILFCSCIRNFYDNADYEYWCSYIYELAEGNYPENSKITIDYLDNIYNYDLPIMSKVYKK